MPISRTARRAGRVCLLGVACLAAVVLLGPAVQRPHAAQDGASGNPLLGDQQAIDRGRSLYRRRCIICHGHAGGRGPNLFASGLSDEQFLETVINGRKGTLMPAFGLRMTPEEVWQVHAFVRSTDRY